MDELNNACSESANFRFAEFESGLLSRALLGREIAWLFGNTIFQHTLSLARLASPLWMNYECVMNV